MDLIVLVVLLSITFSSAQGATPKCCLHPTKHFPREILIKVTKYDVQTSGGVCATDALVLYVENKRYCAILELKRRVQSILEKKKKRNDLRNGSAV